MNADDLMLTLRRAIPSVIESTLVPDGEVYIINDLERQVGRPDGWDAMTAEGKLRWAVDNGMTVVIRGMTATVPTNDT